MTIKVSVFTLLHLKSFNSLAALCVLQQSRTHTTLYTVVY